MFAIGEEAKSITRHYSPGIRSLSAATSLPGVRSKMGYRFAILAVKLGRNPDRLSGQLPPVPPLPQP